MDMPSPSHRIWVDIVTRKIGYRLDFLAAKVLLARLIQSAAEDQSAENISACAEKLHAVYAKNLAVSSAQRDLKTIFGSERS